MPIGGAHSTFPGEIPGRIQQYQDAFLDNNDREEEGDGYITDNTVTGSDHNSNEETDKEGDNKEESKDDSILYDLNKPN